MERKVPPPEGRKSETGTGALCPEAQADGVPCPELGRECSICEKALAWIRDSDQEEREERAR